MTYRRAKAAITETEIIKKSALRLQRDLWEGC